MSNLFFCFFVAVVGAFGILLDARADDFKIVDDGQAAACVVVPDDAPPGVRHAAAEFAYWTEKLTGAKILVGPEPADGLKPIRFATGASEVTGDGFRLTASKRAAEIAAGTCEQGVLFGAYYVLNRFGGVYWCHAESGADIPAHRKDFSLPGGVLVKNPMPLRQGVPSGDGPGATAEVREKCARWNVRNGFPLGQGPVVGDPKKTEPGNLYPNGLIRELGSKGEAQGGGHFPGKLLLETEVDPAEFAKALEWTKAHAGELFINGREPYAQYAKWRVLVRHHPDWFGLVDGQRLPAGVDLREGCEISGHSSMPCLSNPEVRERLLVNFRKWRAHYPSDMPVEWRLICDDQGQWCECDNCMKLLKAKGNNWNSGRGSDYWWDFVNWFAERVLEDQTLTLVVFAYNIYRDLPEKVKPIPRDRMYVAVCPGGRCYLHSIADHNCKQNARFREIFANWKSVGMPVMTFEYPNQTPGACNYLFWERAWIEDLKWYRENGISHGAGGLVGPWASYNFQDNYFRRNAARARWALSWLTGYFEWDPDADFESVRKGLFDVYYRSANTEMQTYRAFLEKALLDTGMCMPYGCVSHLIRKAATGRLITKAETLLGQAEAKAGSDAVLRKRIADERGWFVTNWKATGVSQDMPAQYRIARAVPGDVFAHAKPISDFRKLRHGDVPMKSAFAYEPRTEVCFAHDGTNLFFSALCTEDASAAGTNYAVKVLVTPPGYSADSCYVAMYRDGRRFVEWSPVVPGTKATRPKPVVRFDAEPVADGWKTSASIPLKDFGGAVSGTKWKIDVIRYLNGCIDSRSGSISGMMPSLPEYTDVFEFE